MVGRIRSRFAISAGRTAVHSPRADTSTIRFSSHGIPPKSRTDLDSCGSRRFSAHCDGVRSAFSASLREGDFVHPLSAVFVTAANDAQKLDNLRC